MAVDATRLTVVHRRRLRAVWRSAGWPCQDLVEVELLAAGWLERVRDDAGRETLRVTDAGVQVLAHTLQANRGVREPHEALVARVAREMQRAGRIVWRGLALRAPLPAPAEAEATSPATRWVMAMPDVYSIRHTTREDQALPVVHEVKVRRADLLGELRRPDKAEAYRALASECWYVLKAGIANADEIPPAFGVMQAHPSPDGGFGALEVLRPAPRRPYLVPFAVWMALARAPADASEEDGQAPLAPGERVPVLGDADPPTGL